MQHVVVCHCSHSRTMAVSVWFFNFFFSGPVVAPPSQAEGARQQARSFHDGMMPCPPRCHDEVTQEERLRM